jgi:hypothetical protein
MNRTLAAAIAFVVSACAGASFGWGPHRRYSSPQAG